MNLSFKQYRAVDLTIMAVILAVAETMFSLGTTKWFSAVDYVISPMIAFACLVMMRWNGFAVIHAVIGGVILCLTTGASAEQFAVYAVGNCGVLVALVFLKLIGKKKVADNFLLSALYVIVAYIGTQAGRWLVGLLVGGNLTDIIQYLATDSLSLLFAMLVVLISRKVDGLFEDQKAYLIRTEEERREEQRLRDNDDFNR